MIERTFITVLSLVSSLALLAVAEATGADPQPTVWTPVYPTMLGVTLGEPAQAVHGRMGKPKSVTRSKNILTEEYVRDAGATGLELTIRDGRVIGISFGANDGRRSPAADPFGVTLGADVDHSRAPFTGADDSPVNYGYAVHWEYHLDQNEHVTLVSLSLPERVVGPIRLDPNSGDGHDPAHAVAPLLETYSALAAFEWDYLELSRCDGRGLYNGMRRAKQSVVRRSGKAYVHFSALCTSSNQTHDIYFHLSRMRATVPATHSAQAMDTGVTPPPSQPQPWLPALPAIYGFRLNDDAAALRKRLGPPMHNDYPLSTDSYFFFPRGTGTAVILEVQNRRIVTIESKEHGWVHPKLGPVIAFGTAAGAALAPGVGGSANALVARRGVFESEEEDTTSQEDDAISYGSADGVRWRYGVSWAKDRIFSIKVSIAAPPPSVLLLAGTGDGSAADRPVRAQVRNAADKNRFEAFFIEQHACDGGGGEWQQESKSSDQGIDRILASCNTTGVERQFIFNVTVPR